MRMGCSGGCPGGGVGMLGRGRGCGCPGERALPSSPRAAVARPAPCSPRGPRGAVARGCSPGARALVSPSPLPAGRAPAVAAANEGDICACTRGAGLEAQSASRCALRSSRSRRLGRPRLVRSSLQWSGHWFSFPAPRRAAARPAVELLGGGTMRNAGPKPRSSPTPLSGFSLAAEIAKGPGLPIEMITEFQI